METKKRKLRYVEISDEKMTIFIKEANYPRLYWAMRTIENDQNRTMNYIKYLENQMGTTSDNWEISKTTAKWINATREFFAQRKCYNLIKTHLTSTTKEYEAQHPEGYKPTRYERKRWREKEANMIEGNTRTNKHGIWLS